MTWTGRLVSRYWGMLMVILAAFIAVSCATSPTGRQQFMLLSPEQAISISEKPYEDMITKIYRKGKLISNRQLINRMYQITGRLVAITVKEYPHTAHWKWSLALIDAPNTINAWAMPGGRMAIYSGIINKLRLNDEEIAHIIGHEIAHAVANHGAEKMSMAMGQNLAISVVAQNTDKDSKAAPIANTAATIALQLPNSRIAEEEADNIGMLLGKRWKTSNWIRIGF